MGRLSPKVTEGENAKQKFISVTVVFGKTLKALDFSHFFDIMGFGRLTEIKNPEVYHEQNSKIEIRLLQRERNDVCRGKLIPRALSHVPFPVRHFLFLTRSFGADQFRHTAHH